LERVLATGAGGFTGHHPVTRLKKEGLAVTYGWIRVKIRGW
jgi:hypothetical protein